MLQTSLFPEPPPVLAAADFNGHQVRVVGSPESPQWVAADVCRALGIRNSRDAVGELDDDEKGVALTDTPGGVQNVVTVNESGVYHLIFKSRKAEARRFRRWVTGEVLPCLRRHGCYPAPSMTPAMLSTWAAGQIIPGPLRHLGATITPRTDLIPLSAVPLITWLPRRPAVERVYHWHRHGMRGVYLETIRAAGRLYTSEMSVFIFMWRLAAPNPRPDAPLTLTLAAGAEQAHDIIRAAGLETR